MKRFFECGDHRGLDAKQLSRIARVLDLLNGAVEISDMDFPGMRFHEMTGDRKGTYVVRVTGNRRITFRFSQGHAYDVNLEDYH